MNNINVLLTSFAFIVGMFTAIALLSATIVNLASSPMREGKTRTYGGVLYDWEKEDWFD